MSLTRGVSFKYDSNQSVEGNRASEREKNRNHLFKNIMQNVKQSVDV